MMRLYEIVKTEILERFEIGYNGRTTVITATTDKVMADQMLAIYRSNCGENEVYNIRTIGEPQDSYVDGYEHCLTCSSFARCSNIAFDHPFDTVRCIRFGELKKYVLNGE
jgi:hypothetical protein